LSAEVQGRLAIYLMQVPVVARQSLRRPEDPTWQLGLDVN
jgi:hypothetical protein